MAVGGNLDNTKRYSNPDLHQETQACEQSPLYLRQYSTVKTFPDSREWLFKRGRSISQTAEIFI
jgi:hypothetical protein